MQERRNIMHIVAFNGSPRKKGNTFQTLSHMLERFEKRGYTTELVQMGVEAHGCIGCGLCRKNQLSEVGSAV